VELLEVSVSSDDDNVTIVEAATAGPSVKSVPFVSKLSLNKKRKAENVPSVSHKRCRTYSYQCDVLDSEDFVLARELYDQG
jgi:hypothetical protein